MCSQRISGYTRLPNDKYETPAWCVAALVPHIHPLPEEVWEPAAGSGKIAEALRRAGFKVRETDIESDADFLAMRQRVGAVVCNPPCRQATEFIAHALSLADFVAMLLRTDFDHAQTRTWLFGECPYFAKKLVLTKRIRWFENSTGSPSFNHAWFCWSTEHRGPPTIAYAPQSGGENGRRNLVR